MTDFPLDEIYRRISRFDVIDRDIPIGSGSGFFYWYNDSIFFATNRDNVIIEEEAFLPDYIILHTNADQKPDKTTITLPLYDKKEKPIWRVFLQEQDEVLISIPVPKIISGIDFTRCFLSLYHLPSRVCLQVDDITLTIPVSTCISLASYFFHSGSKNGKVIQKSIEKQGDFKINRKGFATDMVEMVLVLLQRNLDVINELKVDQKKAGEISYYLRIHSNLINELEKIMIQFSDVLDLQIYDKVQKIFNVLKDGSSDNHTIARHLIRKALMLLGQNILFTQ
jgi:hypothetical protein